MTQKKNSFLKFFQNSTLVHSKQTYQILKHLKENTFESYCLKTIWNTLFHEQNDFMTRFVQIL
jgi:hypothetical protein